MLDPPMRTRAAMAMVAVSGHRGLAWGSPAGSDVWWREGCCGWPVHSAASSW